MVDLIHIGVQSRAPCSSPNLQRTGSDLGQSLGVADDLHIPTQGVQQSGSVTEDSVGGVILQSGTCDGEGQLQLLVTGSNLCQLHVLLDVCNSGLFAEGTGLGIVLAVVVLVLALGVCPGNLGHIPHNLGSGTGLVVADRQRGVHSAHNGSTQVHIFHVLCVDADVAVTQLVSGHLLEAAGLHLGQLAVVQGGHLGADVVDGAFLQRIDGVVGGNDLVTDLLDLGVVDLLANGLEVGISLEVDNVVLVEVFCLGVVAVVDVGALVGAGAHGQLDVLGGLDHIAHKLEAGETNTELVVSDVNGILLVITVVVLGSDGQGEVPNSLGVNALDGNLQDVVLIGIGGSAKLVVGGSDGVLGAVDGDLLASHIGVAQGNDTGDVLDLQAVSGHTCVQQNFLSLCGELGLQLAGGCPQGQNLIQLGGDVVVEDVLDSLFHGIDRLLIVAGGQLLDLGAVGLAVGLAPLDGNIAFHAHELEDGVLELGTGLVGFVGEGLLCGGIVTGQLSLEQLHSVLIVSQQVLVGDFSGVVGDGSLIAGAQLIVVILNDFLHISDADIGNAGLLLFCLEQVDQLQQTVLSSLGSGRIDSLVAAAGTGQSLLGSVLSQTDDVGGVHGIGTGVNGVQIHIVVEQNVLHGQGVAVRELDAVLQNEVVGYGAVIVGDDCVVLSCNGLVLAISDGDLAVFVAGADHADLGHSNDGAVICGGGIEGVEQAIQILGHNNESIYLTGIVLLTTGEHGHRAHEHCNAQKHGKNSLFHTDSPLW